MTTNKNIQQVVFNYRLELRPTSEPRILSAVKFAELLGEQTGLDIPNWLMYNWNSGRFTGKTKLLEILIHSAPGTWPYKFAAEMLEAIKPNGNGKN